MGDDENTSTPNDDPFISIPEAHWTIDKQFQAFEEVQDKLYRLLRALATGLVALFTGISILISGSLLKYLPDFGTNWDNALDNLASEVVLSLPVYGDQSLFSISPTGKALFLSIGLILFIGVILGGISSGFGSFLQSVFYILNGLKPPNLKPATGLADVNPDGSSRMNNFDYHSWISENEEIVNDVNEHLDDAYQELSTAFFVSIIVFANLVFVYFVMVRLGIIIDLTLALLFYYYRSIDIEHEGGVPITKKAIFGLGAIMIGSLIVLFELMNV